MPLSGIVVPLVLKPHRDMVVVERPEILDQAVFVLFRPFAGKECNDRGAALQKFGAVTPAATFRIGQRHAFGIPRIPGVFGHAGFLGGGCSVERRKRWTRHGDLEGWCGSVWLDLVSRRPVAHRRTARFDLPSATSAAPLGSAAPAPR